MADICDNYLLVCCASCTSLHSVPFSLSRSPPYPSGSDNPPFSPVEFSTLVVLSGSSGLRPLQVSIIGSLFICFARLVPQTRVIHSFYRPFHSPLPLTLRLSTFPPYL